MSKKALSQIIEFLFGCWPFNVRQARLASTRIPLSEETFVEETASTSIGKAAARMFWAKLHDQGWVCSNDLNAFSPYPDDNLEKIYGLVEEDLDEDIILDIIFKLEIEVPDQETVNKFCQIETPRDLIKFIEAIAVKKSTSTRSGLKANGTLHGGDMAQTLLNTLRSTGLFAGQIAVRLVIPMFLGLFIAWAIIVLGLSR